MLKVRTMSTAGTEADAVFSRVEGFNIKVYPGSNEGCYVDLCINDMVLKSYRYTCYRPTDKRIKQEVKAIMAQWGGEMPVEYLGRQ